MAKFVLNRNSQFTSGPKVREFEECFEKFCEDRVKVVATSSGSTANHLLWEVFLQTHKIDPKDVTVFSSATSWASNASPIIMRGMNINFIDINLSDFSFDYLKLKMALVRCKTKVKVIWVTSLIGFSPEVDLLKNLAKSYGAWLFADLCESTGSFYNETPLLSCFDMATTSTFHAHFVSSCEGGGLFIRKESTEYFDNAQLIRNHGLTRGISNLDKKKAIELKNPDIDPQFLFEKVGTNYRLSDLHAYLGILDFQRFSSYIENRKRLWCYFNSNLPEEYKVHSTENVTPFCLPIIFNQATSLKNICYKKRQLNLEGWETRPIICNLPLSPAYKQYSNGNYPNSDYLSNSGFYVGLNNNLREKDIDNLVSLL